MAIKFLLFIALFSHLALADSNTSQSEPHHAPQTIDGASVVSAMQIVEMVSANKSVILIDSRYSADRKQGYIQGSIALPNTQTNCQTLEQHVLNKKVPVIFYCNGVRCKRSEEAVMVAIACGYHNVFWFRGGYDEWLLNKFPYAKE